MTGSASKFRNAIKALAISSVIAVLLLLGAEACATFEIQRAANRSKDPATGQTRYTMRIGKFPWSRHSVTSINSQGFPDVEFASVPRKNNCIHIVFAGDSFVFGDGVDGDSNFVALVRQWSSEREPGRCVRVFNLGERGTTINRQANAVRETFDKLTPDIVILGQYQNDLTDLTNPLSVRNDSLLPPGHEGGNWTNVRARLGPANLNLVRFLLYQAFGVAIRRDVHYDLLRQWSVLADSTRQSDAERLKETYGRLYESFVNEIRQRGVAFGVVIIPSKFDVLAGRFPEESYFVELARKNQVPYLTVFSLLDQNRSPYAFLTYDGHFNEHGNRLVGQAIYRWMYDTQPPPFPQLRTEPALHARR